MQKNNNSIIGDIKEINCFSILIADDNDVNRLLLKSQLAPHCKNITLAEDGKVALSFLQGNKYDLILLDIQMPFLSGIQLIHMIKQSGSVNMHTPCIAVTAFAQSYQRATLIQAGFDECLIKPVLLDSLQEILNLWLPKTALSNTKNYNTPFDYFTILLNKTSGNIALTTTIFEKLFTELEEQSRSIEDALKSDNLPLANRIIHKLHGSVSFCEFSDLQQIAYQLETSLYNNNKTNIFLYFAELKKKISEFLSLENDIFAMLEESK